MSKLFSPIKIGGVEIKNRAWVSPMCQYSAVEGLIQDWHAVHYGSFITGGAGLVMVEASAVSPEGRITTRCPGIWSDQQAQVWGEVPRFAQRFGVKTGIQLAHAGRKGSSMLPWEGTGSVAPSDGGWQTIAPSAEAFANYAAPREMTLEDIETVKAQFAAAAERGLGAGFDVIEIHAAHGYLLHEFLSPLSNKRTDEYGGSFENRIRLLCEIASLVRLIVPASHAVFVRISATDWIDGGWDVEQSSALVRELTARGIDFVDVSSGGLDSAQKIELGPGYQVPFAKTIHEETGARVSAVGMITTGKQAEEILADGDIEAVMIGRSMLGNPRWPLQAAQDLGDDVPWAKQYERGFLAR
jgi:2,4-dienoyl-CoA reductase-like NADH-dependent reductase (Old Yellow Enzyme family)